MRYELYYWPGIQGRGEFVRLALEDAGADYADVARATDGMKVMSRLIEDATVETPAFAPPFLKAGKLIIGQTANILLYLGEQLGLAPASTAGRLWTHQLQLTIADFLVEVHNTHHPIAASLYYEDQKPEAARHAAVFHQLRLPKFLSYFERVLERNSKGDKYLVGGKASYADLSLFQVIEGLNYAFPTAMGKQARRYRRMMALHERVKARPRIATYLGSPRRLAFNQQGIFRHYPELDG